MTFCKILTSKAKNKPFLENGALKASVHVAYIFQNLVVLSLNMSKFGEKYKINLKEKSNVVSNLVSFVQN